MEHHRFERFPQLIQLDHLQYICGERVSEKLTRTYVADSTTLHVEECNFIEAADGLDYFFRELPVTDEKAAQKFLVPEFAENLRGFSAALAGGSASESWEAKPLEDRTNAWLAEKGLTIKDVAQAARVALTGRTASPGLFDVLAILGKSTSLARLEQGVSRASGSK